MPTDSSAASSDPRPQGLVTVSDELVQAALRAARAQGKDAADVPVSAIAREAGISRSTLIRRLGGSRTALDDAIRAAGIDPGGRPVHARALDAAADLIGTAGLAAATLDAIAVRAGCSVHSLYAVFGGRDALLRETFERHSPLLDIEDFFEGFQRDDFRGDLPATVRRLYGLIARSLNREPRVAPAVLAEALARPESPAVQNLLRHNAPRLLDGLGAWLKAEVQAGNIRDVPLPLLIHQLVTPVVIHMLVRPGMAQVPGLDLPDLDTTCDIFAEAFVFAVGIT
ncbi:TetR family transcriptional regulator [Mycolicibacterium cyprinidarum]|uniref:TetR family transcriptional regulator n=1 Tax=Mycolicibacterium cyprinidarum TaxID=2860311 RepID=A0ABQ4VB31_9MYCO|nr:TetR family transcriptional regulator [Mycolicibacterium sp. NGTWS0302]GJF17433.1 TetR family transcriptional regulator [Mycolicibacterium sp. NGTWSNA01]GJF18499.1 TetR family transcriptional regulator [Mycolicibacterium sp. NGTWS1803]